MIHGRKIFTTTRDRPQMKILNIGYPHSSALLQARLKLERCNPHKAACHPTKCDVINDVKLFSTVYSRIYCRKFLTLPNQTSRYKSKCIRIDVMCLLGSSV